MTGLKDIPDETRWRLAAEFCARMPAMYEAAFRPVVNERYNEIEQEVWMELAKAASGIARSLHLPVNSAKALAETIRSVMVILFGPELKNETLDVPDDRAVILVKRCPFLEHATFEGDAENPVFRRCMAFTLTAVPLLNNQYSARFVRTMCTGDRQCEIKISRKPGMVHEEKKAA
jgi:hypothetical protein